VPKLFNRESGWPHHCPASACLPHWSVIGQRNKIHKIVGALLVAPADVDSHEQETSPHSHIKVRFSHSSNYKLMILIFQLKEPSFYLKQHLITLLDEEGHLEFRVKIRILASKDWNFAIVTGTSIGRKKFKSINNLIKTLTMLKYRNESTLDNLWIMLF
jgi:hypothetical protein